MNKLTEEQHDIVFNWIDSHLFPQERINKHIITSELRSIFEKSDNGFWMDPRVFHEVMNECGFRSIPAGEYNWYYNVSSNCPVITYFRHPEWKKHDFPDD